MTVLRIPRDRLPSSPSERHAALRDYFCDKDAEATLEPEHWALRLAWPDGEDRYIDPRLDEGLAWWGDGVTRPTMAMAIRRQGPILSALYDTWTLYSWSQWVADRHPQSADDIVILHIDDHRDLSAPRLFGDADQWRDSITGAICSVDEPNSVRAAIESGALGMGSFLTPFLHRFPRADVRHLCQPPKAATTRDFRVASTTHADALLEPGRLRPAIELAEAPGVIGPGHYRVTPNAEAWLEGVGNGPVLLHIDMDYFNNRFDGDTDWSSRAAPFDPPLHQIMDKIDEIIEALRRTGVGTRIEDTVIAFSPGFFPAEFWEPAEARLRPALEQLYES